MTDASPEMSVEQAGEFLVTGARFAAVSTLRKDGSPFGVPLGYIYEAPFLYLSLGRARGFVRRVSRDPRVCVTVFNEQFPTVWVILEGTVELIDDPDDKISRKINRKYMSTIPEVDVDEFERNWLAGGRMVYRIRPDRVTGWDNFKKTDYDRDAGLTIAEHRSQKRSAQHTSRS